MAAHGDKVYIVDDDYALRESMSALLLSVGIGSRSFANNEAFFEAFDAADVGCVTANLDGSDGGGLHVLKILRGLGAPVPVILLSARVGIKAQRQATSAGAAALLERPANPREFILLVRRLLSA